MAFNFWQDQGTVIPAVNSDQPEQPNVIYEGNSQMGNPGNVFKMWFTAGAISAPGLIGLCYAESLDGLSWTRYSSNPVLSNVYGGRVFKYGSTYYCYTSIGGANTHIASYTSSDGISWSLGNSQTLTA